jgi:hypothetical protein
MTEVGRTGPTASGIEAAKVITQLAFCVGLPTESRISSPRTCGTIWRRRRCRADMPEQTALTNLLKEDEL